MATGLRSISFVFAAMLLLATVHKARSAGAGTATAEPLMRLTEWRRRHATSLLLAAALIEALVCVALLIRPTIGFAALTALALFYAVNLRRLSPNDGCNCFGSAFKSPSRRAAIARNAGIAAISAAGVALYATTALPVAPDSQATVGVALVVMAAALSVDLLRYVPRPAPPTQSRG
jgi:hypothetical protein